MNYGAGCGDVSGIVVRQAAIRALAGTCLGLPATAGFLLVPHHGPL